MVDTNILLGLGLGVVGTLVPTTFFIKKLLRKLKELQSPVFVIQNIEKFKTVVGIVEFYCEREFDLIDKLYIRPLDVIGGKLDEQEIENLRKLFCKNVLEKLGPTLTNAFIMYNGSLENVIKFINDFFEFKLYDNRIIGLELRKNLFLHKVDNPDDPANLVLDTWRSTLNHK